MVMIHTQQKFTKTSSKVSRVVELSILTL